MEMITLKAFTDNYIYLLKNDRGRNILVDPGDTDVICDFLEENISHKPHYILVTHHHSDHIAAVGTLFSEYRCDIIVPQVEAHKIPDAIHHVKDGDVIPINDLSITAIETPGHTKGHMCYYIPEIKVLFSGDTLFAYGCGRLLEGTPGQMFHSLQKLRALPDDVNVYCGHEYTLKNIAFTRDFSKQIGFTLPDDFDARADKIQKLRDADETSMPFLLGDEKRHNLFMQADNPELIKLLEAHGEVEAFAKIRQARNAF